MQIQKTDSTNFTARFHSDFVTKEALRAVKRNAYVIGNSEKVEHQLKLFRDKCPKQAYKLSINNDLLEITGAIKNTYRQTEPIKGEISSSFMQLMGKFINSHT